MAELCKWVVCLRAQWLNEGARVEGAFYFNWEFIGFLATIYDFGKGPSVNYKWLRWSRQYQRNGKRVHGSVLG